MFGSLVSRLAVVGALAAMACLAGHAASAEPTAEEKGVAFLAREVPKWPVENRCYSCHNNGDGVRALYAARKVGIRFDNVALTSTTAWLTQPDRWEQNGGKAEFSDKKLAAIQFAAALLAAMDAGAFAADEGKGRVALLAAAKKVAADQDADGAWRIDAEGVLGSPVTYGPVLATTTSLKVLSTADKSAYARQIGLAHDWLIKQNFKAVPDAAAALLGLVGPRDEASQAQVVRCLELLKRAQDKSGGWGPYVNSAPEPFDTAIALLALVPFREREEISNRISRGRAYLIEVQLKDGSWIETTRPAGAESYAQRLSTTGWATLALQATREARPQR